MPATTLPKAAKPWPSGLRAPPKSSDGWSLMQMNQPELAVGRAAAIETAPSTCLRPVTVVRSSGIAGKPSLVRSAFTPAWMTSIFTGLSGWLSIFTVRWKVPPS
jgi:hypothetical protein